MTRSQQIKHASIIPIGGCEDQAKKNVLRLFKKSNNINYASLDKDYIINKNIQYKEDQKRYNFLLNKMFDQILNDNEQLEFDILSDHLGSYTNTYYITKIIEYSKIVINMLHQVKKVIKKFTRTHQNQNQDTRHDLDTRTHQNQNQDTRHDLDTRTHQNQNQDTRHDLDTT